MLNVIVKILGLKFLLILFTQSLIGQNIEDIVYREESISSLLKQIEEDRSLQLEWLTSIHFHKLINDYRNSKNKKSIFWDNVLWLAARNHNVYMKEHDILGHHQAKKKVFFSGVRPSDRVDYTNYNSKELGIGISENCFNNPYFEVIDKTSAFEELNAFAASAAKNAFEAWKKSSGHNENMLRSENMSHGTSFLFTNSGFVATSVFVMNLNFYEPDEILLSHFEDLINDKTIAIQNDFHDIDIPKDQLKRTNYKHFYFLVETMKSKEVESNDALYKMVKSKNIPNDQKELNKAYKKSKGIKGFFELMSKKVNHHEERIRLSYEDFVKLKGADTLRSRVKSVLAGYAGKEINSWGGDVITKRYDEEVEIKISILILAQE